MIKYGHIKSTDKNFLEAIEVVKYSLVEKGFSILWELDVKSKVKEKLGKDFDNCTILGACNAPIAYSVLNHEIEAGLLLPCNVIIFEKGGKVFIGFLSPTQILSLTQNDDIKQIASEIEKLLKEIFESII